MPAQTISVGIIAPSLSAASGMMAMPLLASTGPPSLDNKCQL